MDHSEEEGASEVSASEGEEEERPLVWGWEWWRRMGGRPVYHSTMGRLHSSAVLVCLYGEQCEHADG